jgi:hypothetical protein
MLSSSIVGDALTSASFIGPIIIVLLDAFGSIAFTLLMGVVFRSTNEKTKWLF